MPRKTPKYMEGNSSIEKVFLKKKIEAKSPNQRKYIRSIKSNDVTFCNGPAGSGKTHLAVAMAVLSSNADITIPKQFTFAAEISLSGELRGVNRIEQRIKEADKFLA